MTELNASIMKVCSAVSDLQTPETFDIMVTILRSQWKVIGLSFIIVPVVVYTLLYLLMGKTGKIDRMELWLLNVILISISIIIGIIMYLLLNVHSVPFINI